MVQLWKIHNQLDEGTLCIEGYGWDENGLKIGFSDERQTLYLEITFHLQIEFAQLKYADATLYYNDDVYDLMVAANVYPGQINPFFIVDNLPEEEIDSLNLYCEKEKELKKYIMVTDDFWITVLSSIPPEISVLPFSQKP